jgi:PAS domain S-box-containing protein
MPAPASARRLLFGYSFALVSVALFTALKLLTEGEGTRTPFIILRLPVLLTAYGFGLAPALFALLLSALAADYFFIEPVRQFVVSPAALYSILLYILETSAMIAIIIALRWALQAASRRQNELARTEEKLRVALEGSSITVSECDQELRHTWVYNLPPGFTAEAVLGKKASEIWPSDEAMALQEAQQEVLRSGNGVRMEFSSALPTGLRTYEMVIEPQRSQAGTVDGVINALVDITERRRYEDALHREEARFRELADSMPQIVWSADATGYIDYWNRRWYDFTGFPEGEGGDDSWLPAAHPDDVQPALNSWYKSVSSGEPLQIECRMRDIKAGEYHWFLNRAVPVRDPHGTINRWYGSLTDLHDYKGAIEALRKSEERFRSLVEATAQVVWSTDAEGKLKDASQWNRVTGQTNDQSRGYGWLKAVHPEDREMTLQRWEDARQNVALFSAEYRIRIVDGNYRWFSARGVPVKDPDGSIREWVGLCVDIEERRRAEEQMQHAAEAMAIARDAAVQANRAKSSFLANISHELRTPLNAILGYAEILQEDLRQLEQPQMLSDVDHIYTAGTHLLNVVNDLLDISKIEAGRMTLQLSEVNLEQLLQDSCSTVRTMADRNGNRLEVYASCAGTIKTDTDKLRQILVNLLGNACKFTHNGEINVRCDREMSADTEMVTFAVQDTGIGIAEEDLPRLFHDFSQLDSSFTRRYGGTGLGLAISQRFARLLGGTITVTSSVGDGSTFTLRIRADATPLMQQTR